MRARRERILIWGTSPSRISLLGCPHQPAAYLPLLLLCFAAEDPKPEPKAEKEKPIDYEAMLNDKLSKGITREKNANVLIWKAFGPSWKAINEYAADYFKRLASRSRRKRASTSSACVHLCSSNSNSNPRKPTRSNRNPQPGNGHGPRGIIRTSPHGSDSTRNHSASYSKPPVGQNASPPACLQRG